MFYCHSRETWLGNSKKPIWIDQSRFYISCTCENFKMFNITSNYFSFFNNKTPASWVAHITGDFFTCYSCPYYSSMGQCKDFKKYFSFQKMNSQNSEEDTVIIVASLNLIKRKRCKVFKNSRKKRSIWTKSWLFCTLSLGICYTHVAHISVFIGWRANIPQTSFFLSLVNEMHSF